MFSLQAWMFTVFPRRSQETHNHWPSRFLSDPNPLLNQLADEHQRADADQQHQTDVDNFRWWQAVGMPRNLFAGGVRMQRLTGTGFYVEPF